MNFLRSKNFAITIAVLTVAAFVLPGVGREAMVVAAVVAVGLWWVMTRKPKPEARLYAELLRKAHGDTSRVHRLIEHEVERNPKASRAQHIRNAIVRWERDLN